MNDIEFIEELDKRIELVRNAWAEDLLKLFDNASIPENSIRHERIKNKLAKKYAPLIADMLTLRQTAYDRAYQKQEKEYAEQFEEPIKEQPLLDEYGRPTDKYWKNGAWHKYKKPINNK